MTKEELQDMAVAKQNEAFQVIYDQKNKYGITYRSLGDITGYDHAAIHRAMNYRKTELAFFTVAKMLMALNVDIDFTDIKNPKRDMKMQAVFSEIMQHKIEVMDGPLRLEVVPTARILEVFKNYGAGMFA